MWVKNALKIIISGRKQAPRFLCEVRVTGHSYVGVGNSTTKKEAQFNAARDFVQYLIRQGAVNENEVPADVSNFSFFQRCQLKIVKNPCFEPKKSSGGEKKHFIH